jgi:putative peptidoglycan lipid II flippase
MTPLGRAVRHPALRSAVDFAGVTSVVKVAAFVKEAVVAAVFGVSGAIDAYLMAFVVIGFPVNLLTNAAYPVFVREHVRLREEEGDDAVLRYVRTCVVALIVVLAVILAVWFALMPHIVNFVGRGLDPGRRDLVRYATYGLGLYYFLIGVNILGLGALHASKRFVLGAITPIVTPIVTIVLLLVGGPHLVLLVVALTVGTGIETVLILRRVFATPAARNLRDLLPIRRLAHLAQGTALLVPGTVAAGLAPMIEQTIASGLGHGAIASLGFAAKLPATISSLLVAAVGATIMPYFAEMLAANELARCRRFYLRYVTLLAFGGALLSAGAIVLSQSVVRIAFERGAFLPSDTATVAGIQQAYLLQLPGALVGMLSVRLIAARGAFGTLTIANVAIVPLAALLQWQFAQIWGARGLALGTSAGATASALLFVCVALWSIREDQR